MDMISGDHDMELSSVSDSMFVSLGSTLNPDDLTVPLVRFPELAEFLRSEELIQNLTQTEFYTTLPSQTYYLMNALRFLLQKPYRSLSLDDRLRFINDMTSDLFIQFGPAAFSSLPRDPAIHPDLPELSNYIYSCYWRKFLNVHFPTLASFGKARSGLILASISPNYGKQDPFLRNWGWEFLTLYCPNIRAILEGDGYIRALRHQNEVFLETSSSENGDLRRYKIPSPLSKIEPEVTRISISYTNGQWCLEISILNELRTRNFHLKPRGFPRLKYVFYINFFTVSYLIKKIYLCSRFNLEQCVEGPSPFSPWRKQTPMNIYFTEACHLRFFYRNRRDSNQMTIEKLKKYQLLEPYRKSLGDFAPISEIHDKIYDIRRLSLLVRKASQVTIFTLNDRFHPSTREILNCF